MRRKIKYLLILFVIISSSLFAADKSTTVSALYDCYLFPAYNISKQGFGGALSRRSWYTPEIGLTYSFGAVFPIEYRVLDDKVTGLENSVLVNADFLFSYKYSVSDFSFGAAGGVGGELDILRLSATMPTFKLNASLVLELFAEYSINDYIGLELGLRTSTVFLSSDIISPDYSYSGFSTISFRPYLGFFVYTSDCSSFGLSKF